MILKLNAITIASFIVPFLILMLSGKLSIDNTIDYICAALAIIAPMNVQYVIFLKKGSLIISGDEIPKYDGCSIFYQNYQLHAKENDIYLVSISIFCNERCEYYFHPVIQVPCLIQESTYSEKFDIELKPTSGELPRKIELVCVYKIPGEKKERKVKSVIRKEGGN